MNSSMQTGGAVMAVTSRSETEAEEREMERYRIWSEYVNRTGVGGDDALERRLNREAEAAWRRIRDRLELATRTQQSCAK